MPGQAHVVRALNSLIAARSMPCESGREKNAIKLQRHIGGEAPHAYLSGGVRDGLYLRDDLPISARTADLR